jgi:hypothetical protein
MPRLPVFPPGCPSFRTFRLSRRWCLGLPRAFHPSALPLGRFFGSPRVLAPSASPPSVSAGSPRPPHLPVVPAMEPRVAPCLASFGAAGSLICGLPRRSALPAAPLDVSTGLPRLPHPLALPTANLRVTPNLPALGVAAFASPGLPLGPALTAGSMMNPWPVSNFASSACAADESSRPIRSCTSLPDPGCSFNLIPSAHYRTSRPQTDFLKSLLASSCQAGSAGSIAESTHHRRKPRVNSGEIERAWRVRQRQSNLIAHEDSSAAQAEDAKFETIGDSSSTQPTARKRSNPGKRRRRDRKIELRGNSQISQPGARTDLRFGATWKLVSPSARPEE